MNREEIIQRLDIYFGTHAQRGKTYPKFDTVNVTTFFFDEILPEVLKDLVETPKIDIGEENTVENSHERGIVFGINARAGKFIVDAKEKYNIIL